MTTNSQTTLSNEQAPEKKFLGVSKEEWKIIGKEALSLMYIISLGILLAICMMIKDGSKARE